MSNVNKNQWFIWLVVVGVVIVTLIAFNYSGDKTEVVSLSDIFSEEELGVVAEVEYEFVKDQGQTNEAPQQVAKVEVIPSQPQAAEVAVKIPAITETQMKANAAYAIQILASKNKELLQKDLSKIKEKGYPAYIISKDLGNKGTWYRIYVGSFDTKSQADDYLPKVRENYKDGFIISLK